MRIFITGGTGLLGNTIVRQLVDQRPDCALTALVRHQPDPAVFNELPVEFVFGDLGDLGDLRDLGGLGDPATHQVIQSTVESCDVVIHCAALIHIGWQRLEESMRVNRDGTALIVDACLRYRKPLVHIGTVDTLAVGTRTEPSDETTPIEAHGGKTPCSYVLSKRAGVEVVLDGARRGLRCVILHPGFMLGPWDWKPSSGRMIVEVAKAWRPLAPAGGCSMCDARDVADGVIEAMDALLDGFDDGKALESGRQYILGGENWTYFELWCEIAKRTGTRRPIMPAGPAQFAIGNLAVSLMEKWATQEGDINTASMALSRQFHWYDSSRARRELGYRSRDPHTSLDDAVEWIRTLPSRKDPAPKSDNF